MTRTTFPTAGRRLWGEGTAVSPWTRRLDQVADEAGTLLARHSEATQMLAAAWRAARGGLGFGAVAAPPVER